MSSTAGRAALTPLEQQVRRFMRSVQRAESHAAREEPLLAVKESCQALRDMAALIAPMIEQIQTLTADRNALQARVGALEGLTTDLGTVVGDLRQQHQVYGPPPKTYVDPTFSAGLSPELREALEQQLRNLDKERRAQEKEVAWGDEMSPEERAALVQEKLSPP
jgi:hypothetical protein